MSATCVRDILGALRSRARSAANPNGAGRAGGALRCLLSSEVVVVRRARCQSAKVVCVTAKVVCVTAKVVCVTAKVVWF